MKHASRLGYIFLLLSILNEFSAISLNAQPITLTEALKIARSNNLKLLQQFEEQKIAGLEHQIIRSERLPKLDFSLSSSYLSKVNRIDLQEVVPLAGRSIELGGHERSEVMLTVSQPIFTGFRLNSLHRIAGQHSLDQEAKTELLLNEVYHKVHELYYRVLGLHYQQQTLDASLKRLAVQRDKLRSLFQAAQVMAFDTLQVYNQLLVLNLENENLALSRRLLRVQMQRLLDLPAERPIQIVQLAPPDSMPPTLTTLQTDAMRFRPELSRIRIARQIANLQRRVHRAGYFPQVFAAGNLHFAKPGLDPVANQWMDYFSVGIQLRWNLWRWQSDRRRMEISSLTGNRLAFAEQELVSTIMYEIRDSYEKLVFSLKRMRLSKDLRQQQAERYRILSAQHQNGVATTNDLVTAETDLTAAELQVQQAIVQYHLNRAALYKATGQITGLNDKGL